MSRLAKVVTGSLMLATSSWAGVAAGGSFDEALGATTPGILVESPKSQPFSSAERAHSHLATDTHDAMVNPLTIDAHLLEEGLIHNGLEGPIGPDDPSVTGEIRPRPRIVVKPAAAAVPASAEPRATQAVFEPISSLEPGFPSEAEEPLLITDRVAEAEAIETTGGWVDRAKSAFARLLKRQP